MTTFAENSDTSHGCPHRTIRYWVDCGYHTLDCESCHKRWSMMPAGTEPRYSEDGLLNHAPPDAAYPADECVAPPAPETLAALKRARDTAVDAWERHANADERRDPAAPYHDNVRQRIADARNAGEQMGRRILCEMVHGTEMFLVWSSIVDAPITYGMSKDELFEWTTHEEGRRGREQLERDFERPRFGTVDDELACNRAGADETHLTREQIIDYFERRGAGEQPIGTTHSDEDDPKESCSQCGAEVLGYHRCESTQ